MIQQSIPKWYAYLLPSSNDNSIRFARKNASVFALFFAVLLLTTSALNNEALAKNKPTLNRIQTYVEMKLKKNEKVDGKPSHSAFNKSTLVQCIGPKDNLESCTVGLLMKEDTPQSHIKYFRRRISHVVAAIYGRKHYDGVMAKFGELLQQGGGSFILLGDTIEVTVGKISGANAGFVKFNFK
jgi:hypothetical protein